MPSVAATWIACDTRNPLINSINAAEGFVVSLSNRRSPR